jgi:hypothetical protein
LEWLFERGKKLERACAFANALKYYFAGKMYFARRNSAAIKLPKMKREFDKLFKDLLPMTNAEVIHSPL